MRHRVLWQWTFAACAVLVNGCVSTEPSGRGGAEVRPGDDQNAASIVVRIQEGASRPEWLAFTVSEKAGTQVLSASGDLDGVDSSFEAYCDASREASKAAFDMLIAQGRAGKWLSSEYAREWNEVVPAPGLGAALIMFSNGDCQGFVATDGGDANGVASDVTARVRRVVTWNRDGQRVALRASTIDRDVWRHNLIIADRSQGTVLCDIDMKRLIADIAWSPGGSQVAVLCFSQRRGDGLIDRALDSLGHGAPYLDFSLVIVNVASGDMIQAPLLQDVKSGTGEIMWDRQATRSMLMR